MLTLTLMLLVVGVPRASTLTSRRVVRVYASTPVRVRVRLRVVPREGGEESSEGVCIDACGWCHVREVRSGRGGETHHAVRA